MFSLLFIMLNFADNKHEVIDKMVGVFLLVVNGFKWFHKFNMTDLGKINKID